MVQYGAVTSIENNSNKTATFPTSFSTVVYTVMSCPYNYTVSYTHHTCAYSITLTNCKLRNYRSNGTDSNSLNVYYMAYGI